MKAVRESDSELRNPRPEDEWLKGCGEGLHRVAPSIVMDARGVAYIEGTTTKVIEVALVQQASGLSSEERQAELPHLSQPQVNAALAYYSANREACDAYIERGRRLAEQLRAEAGESPVAKRLRKAGLLR